MATCFSVRPGVTGLWRVCGRAGQGLAKRVALDLACASAWRLARDLSILARTLSAAPARRGWD